MESLVIYSLLATAVVGQLPIEGTLNNLSVEDNDTTLIVSWTTDERDIPFQFIHVTYQQAFPDHSTNNHFVTLTNSKLSVDGTKFTYTLDKRTLVPKFLGPLLLSVTASTQNSMYHSDEVLYTPSDNDQSSADFELSISLSAGMDCSGFMEKVSNDIIVNELEFKIRLQSSTFQRVGKIDHFYHHCSSNSVICRGSILTSGNATEYHGVLLKWVHSADNFLVLGGQRYTVMLTSDRSTDDKDSGSTEAVTDENTFTTATIAIAIAFIALAVVVILLLGMVLYLLFSKCSFKKNLKRSDSDYAMSTRNGRGNINSEDKNGHYVDMN